MAEAPSQTLKRTPLYDRHVAAAARLVPFAGWEMPVQYAGITGGAPRGAHGARASSTSPTWARSRCSGPQAEAFLQRVLSNDVAKLARRRRAVHACCAARTAASSTTSSPTGSAPERFLTVTNAANHEKDLAWFRKQAERLRRRGRPTRSTDYAMLAVQGPQAREIVAGARRRRRCPSASPPPRACSRGRSALVCGTGYTGEDGVELLIAPDDAAAMWDELVRRGAAPAGLGARDTLRLEVCYHLYGNDLMEERGPIEAGLGWCCKEDTGFIGSDAVRAVREAGPAERLVAFAHHGPGIARQGNAIDGGGVVTSGTLSPCLDVGIGMAYCPPSGPTPGTAIEIDVRGKTRDAEVAEKPLYTQGD